MVDQRYIDHWKTRTKSNDRGCLLFVGALRNGYAKATVREANRTRTVSVHKEVFLYEKGEYDLSLDLDHLCRNRNCINAEHLEPVVRQVNVIRGEGVTAENYRKTHCKRGHELTGANLLQDHGRRCRACNRIKWHRNKNTYRGGN